MPEHTPARPPTARRRPPHTHQCPDCRAARNCEDADCVHPTLHPCGFCALHYAMKPTMRLVLYHGTTEVAAWPINDSWNLFATAGAHDMQTDVCTAYRRYVQRWAARQTPTAAAPETAPAGTDATTPERAAAPRQATTAPPRRPVRPPPEPGSALPPVVMAKIRQARRAKDRKEDQA